MILTRTSKVHGTHDILVDDEDMHLLQGWGLYIVKHRRLFARLYRYENGKLIQKYLHHQILGSGKDDYTDFVNGNALDCRRQNLKKQTHADLMEKARKSYQDSRSGKNRAHHSIAEYTGKYKNIYYQKDVGKFTAKISVNLKRIHLGTFKTEKEAALAYNEAARLYFGETAVLLSIGELNE